MTIDSLIYCNCYCYTCIFIFIVQKDFLFHTSFFVDVTDSPGPTAPGAYPHRDRGGRKNNDRAEEKRSSGPGGTGGGGGRNKRPHRNSTKSSDNNYYMNYQQERDIIAKLQHEAQLEAEAIRQNREADFKPSDEILKFLAGL